MSLRLGAQTDREPGPLSSHSYCVTGGQSSEDAAAVLRTLDAEEAARRQLRPAGSGYLGGRGRGRGGDLLGEGSGGCEEILEGPVTC